MERQLILHQLNAVGVSPAEFIEIAAANDCGWVTLFTFDGGSVVPRSNTGLTYPEPVTQANKAEVLAALARTGVQVNGVEFFPMTDAVDIGEFRPALELGRELGATRASSHIFITDDALVLEKLGDFCDMADEMGYSVTSEYCPMTPGSPTIARAKWLAENLNRPNFGINVDTLHTVRSGGTPAEVAGIETRHIGITQINDSKGLHTSTNYIADVHNREPPGWGDLPLKAILDEVPAEMPIEIEVPAAHRRKAGVTAAEHCRDVIEGTRKVVATLAPRR